MICFAGVSSTEVGSSTCLRKRTRMRKRKGFTMGKLQRKKRDECLGA